MSTCLGIYIDKNIIKYAKVSKDKTSATKVDAFGIKVYSDLRQTIQQIVDETFSFKVPVSVNLSEEMYNYFYMSDLLNKNDLKKAIKTEFESYCYDVGLNPNALESRYVLVNDITDKNKIKVIHISEDKIKLNNLINSFDQIKATTISPMPIAIANIAPLEDKENIAIVNIENKTTVTIVNGEKVYQVHELESGAGEILEAINTKENSCAKAYEICKNTTIYTMQGRDLEAEENEHLSDIVPILYKIATEVNQILDESLIKITKVYITGTASIINNIDLYFEELINGNVKCEILKPFFIENSPKTNIKDYIEVNSAVALALQGLDFGIKNINFSNVKPGFQISLGKNEDKQEGNEGRFSGFLQRINNISFADSIINQWFTRAFSFVLLIFIIYSLMTLFIGYQINTKNKQVAETTENTNKQITLIKNDINKINIKTTEYNTLIKNLQDASSAISEKNSYKNTIPTLLSQIRTIIPRQVQLTSIENPTSKKIIINAQSKKYEQLAYLKARIKSEGILEPTSVVSTEAIKDGDLVKIVIEGELP